MFYTGQKVVCLGMRSRPSLGEIYPRKGRIYTIRSIVDGHALLLEEIINKTYVYSDGPGEIAFHLSRFRPLQERKTDISVFTEMLKPRKVEEPI